MSRHAYKCHKNLLVIWQSTSVKVKCQFPCCIVLLVDVLWLYLRFKVVLCALEFFEDCGIFIRLFSLYLYKVPGYLCKDTFAGGAGHHHISLWYIVISYIKAPPRKVFQFLKIFSNSCSLFPLYALLNLHPHLGPSKLTTDKIDDRPLAS